MYTCGSGRNNFIRTILFLKAEAKTLTKTKALDCEENLTTTKKWFLFRIENVAADVANDDDYNDNDDNNNNHDNNDDDNEEDYNNNDYNDDDDDNNDDDDDDDDNNNDDVNFGDKFGDDDGKDVSMVLGGTPATKLLNEATSDSSSWGLLKQLGGQIFYKLVRFLDI